MVREGGTLGVRKHVDPGGEGPLLEDELEHEATELDAVGVLELTDPDQRAVHVGAVGAAEVAEAEACLYFSTFGSPFGWRPAFRWRLWRPWASCC